MAVRLASWSVEPEKGHSLLQGLASLLAQALQIRRIAARTHSASVIRRELLLFNFDLRVVPWDENGSTGFAASDARALGATPTVGLVVGYGRRRREGRHMSTARVVGLRHRRDRRRLVDVGGRGHPIWGRILGGRRRGVEAGSIKRVSGNKHNYHQQMHPR